MDWNPAPIEDKLSIHFKDSDLLFQSLIHPSYADQISEPDQDNERLEYLGEAILRLVITNYLYQNCPYLPVSKLTAIRDKLEDGERLTNLWFHLGLGESFPFLALKDERHRLRLKRNNPFEKACKALVGAMHLDRGLSQTYNWLKKQLIDPLLARHLKDITERSAPDKQLQFLGDALFKAIVIDYLYGLLPYINPARLAKIAKPLVTKEQQTEYLEQVTPKDWEIINKETEKSPKTSFPMVLGAMYLHFDRQNSKTSFRETQSWWAKNYLDEDEILQNAITLLLKDDIPQKWIIHQVLGYESRNYNEGRERFHELMEYRR